MKVKIDFTLEFSEGDLTVKGVLDTESKYLPEEVKVLISRMFDEWADYAGGLATGTVEMVE